MSEVKKKITKTRKAAVAKQESVKKEELDPSRMQNDPVPVSLTIGDFEVKELKFFKFVSLVRKQIETYWTLFDGIDIADMSAEDTSIVLLRFSSVQDFEQRMAEIFSSYCGHPNDPRFLDLTLEDVETLLPLVISKIDFEGIKRLFTQTLPKSVESLVKEIPTTTEK